MCVCVCEECASVLVLVAWGWEGSGEGLVCDAPMAAIGKAYTINDIRHNLLRECSREWTPSHTRQKEREECVLVLENT